MYRVLFSFFIFFNALLSFIAGETGCPPNEHIRPCECTNRQRPILTCNRILNTDDLIAVFDVSARYTFQEVHIKNAAFLYIPVQIFSKAYVKELYLTSSAISTIFDKPLELNDIQHPYKLHIESTKILQTLTSTNFTSFTNLTEIIVESTPMSVLTATFSSSLPSGLKKLSLIANGITHIRPGALRLLHNLDKFYFNRNDVKNLTRDIFPKPWNGRILNFDFNRIDTIPNDMFTEMPNLQFLSMQKNRIRTIPESAFQGRVHNVPYFQFSENPFDCDCGIFWIIKDKPEMLGGRCNLPFKFYGRALDTLAPSEFSC